MAIIDERIGGIQSQFKAENVIISKIYKGGKIAFISLARRYGFTMQETEDIIQNFFGIHLCGKDILTLKEFQNKPGYCYGAFRNFLRTHLQKNNRRPLFKDIEVEAILKAAPNSENSFEAENRIAAIIESITIHFGKKNSQIIMGLIKGQEREEIAEKTGLSITAINTRISRIRKDHRYSKIIEQYL